MQELAVYYLQERVSQAEGEGPTARRDRLGERGPECRAVRRGQPRVGKAAEADPEGDFFEAIVDEEVLQHIQAIPEDYRVAVVLSDLEGLSYQEIAEMTDVPVGTVKSRLFRGRRLLQKELFDYAVSMGYIQDNPDGA